MSPILACESHSVDMTIKSMPMKPNSSEIRYIVKHPLYPLIHRLEEALDILQIQDLDEDSFKSQVSAVIQIGKVAKQYCLACLVFKPASGSVESWVIQSIVHLGLQCLMAIDVHQLYSQSLLESIAAPSPAVSTCLSTITLDDFIQPPVQVIDFQEAVSNEDDVQTDTSELDEDPGDVLFWSPKLTNTTRKPTNPICPIPPPPPTDNSNILGIEPTDDTTAKLYTHSVYENERPFQHDINSEVACSVQLSKEPADPFESDEESDYTECTQSSSKKKSRKTKSTHPTQSLNRVRKSIQDESNSSYEEEDDTHDDEEEDWKVSKRRHTKQSMVDKRCRPNYSDEITNVLKQWLYANAKDPYPSEKDKQKLSKATDLSILQINNWFINGRRRYLKGVQYQKRKYPSHLTK